MSKTILVVDDDRDIVRLIADGLKYESFEVRSAYSGAEALEEVRSGPPPDFVILDIMMPGMDGFEVCRLIREQHNTPILFLSARDREMDKIIGLEIGADDYMTKPFSVQELTSRVKAHFRKMERLHKEWESKQEESQHSSFIHAKGDLVLNEATFEAHLRGRKLDLSTKEFQILLYFFGHPNRVLTREQIYASVWGDDYGDMNTVTVHIKNIRKKLGAYSECIKTVWGVGYKFAAEGLRL